MVTMLPYALNVSINIKTESKSVESISKIRSICKQHYAIEEYSHEIIVLTFHVAIYRTA